MALCTVLFMALSTIPVVATWAKTGAAADGAQNLNAAHLTLVQVWARSSAGVARREPPARLLLSGAACDTHWWLEAYAESPGDCVATVLQRNLCSHKFFIHGTGARGRCGCVHPKTDCSDNNNLVNHDGISVYRLEVAPEIGEGPELQEQFSLLHAESVCSFNKWLPAFALKPENCMQWVTGDADCSHEYFIHATGADGHCGCVQVGADCTNLTQIARGYKFINVFGVSAGATDQGQVALQSSMTQQVGEELGALPASPIPVDSPPATAALTQMHTILDTQGSNGQHANDLEGDLGACEGSEERLSSEEVLYAKCPAGNYQGSDEANARWREARLRKAICAAKRRGWRGGHSRDETHYLRRGYATFESAMWPKDPTCSNGFSHRGDAPRKYMTKLANASLGAEFRLNWKVASTAFSQYFECEYGGSWEVQPATEPTPQGTKVVAAVREPISRLTSALGEILERAINHWCPERPCGPHDGFNLEVVLNEWEHMTTWYDVVKAENGGYTESKLPLLMERMIYDAACNYGGYAADHLTTQTLFIAGADQSPLTEVVKLEEMDSMRHQMNAAIGKDHSECVLNPLNDNSKKPPGNPVPSNGAMRAYLEENADLMRQVCLMYAQDFVCFGFELPTACKGLF